ncbi:hypothetical protein [Pedobacter heparinus]|uniref:hypothetical protein n=1 Tax=Pedobacter heparinus TaxID=984 RepID=UPI00292FA242|nr:hypothetical protein [Pedobacter heparinus]
MIKQTLAEKLTALSSSTPENTLLLSNLFVRVFFKKGMILSINDYAFPILYFIETGLARGYFYHQQKEYTYRAMENGFLMAMASLQHKKQVVEYITFMTDTHGWSLNLAKAQLLARKEPSLYHILLEIQQESIMDGKARELMLRLKTAEDMYVYLQESSPSLVHKLSNQILASLLNIKLKYLYQVKKRQRNK